MQMGQALLSSNWYRVAALRPRLRGHAHIHRHVYRGEVWYVIEDKLAAKYHRFNPASYRVIGLLDGRLDMQAVWTKIIAELADQTPSQDDIIGLLGQLYGADLLQCDVKPDLAHLFLRRGQHRRRLFLSRFANPMSMRFPLFDPDAFLERLIVVCPWLGNIWGLLIWLMVVLPTLGLAPSHWTELTQNFNEQLLTIDNILMMGLVFPVVKTLHELGHGVACKIRGGAVHEMGVMLLVFFPAPYVDASSASAFSQKSQRILVGAAGMLTEIFVAALAFYAWLLLEPGVTRSLAYNAIVLASITTLAFNANPLLRYDGYYMLADWLEMPNFANRCTKYWQYLVQRYVLGNQHVQVPTTTSLERRWFIAYEPLAFTYRLFVMFSIAIFIAQQYFFLGVLIALWGLISSFLWPLFKAVRSLIAHAGTAYSGSRALGVALGFLFSVILMLFVLPMPNHTSVEGVLWPPEDSIIRAETSGFVDKILVEPNTMISQGQAILIQQDPEIQAKWTAQRARVEEVQAQYDAAWGVDPSKALQLQDTLHHEQAAAERLALDVSHLTLRSHADGRLLVQNPEDLPGSWLAKGEVIGYVQNQEAPRVRVVVDQDQVDEVRLGTREIAIKLPQALAETWIAVRAREMPAANKALPSSALGQEGGGDIVIDPRDDEGIQTLKSLFEFELVIQRPIPYHYLGSRVYVRFQHPAEPMGFRFWRAVRRLFLSQFLY